VTASRRSRQDLLPRICTDLHGFSFSHFPVSWFIRGDP
jgi:hypothetical protein